MIPLGMTKEDVMDAISETNADYKKCKHILQELLLGYIDPYTQEINGKNCGDLPRRAWKFMFHFDDSE